MSTDIKIKGIRMEDFVNYKKPSMFIGFPTCSFKCCKEGNFPIEVCQNCELANASTIEVDVNSLIERYMSNPITKAVVCGGLEPLDSWEDLQCFITNFRHWSGDSVVVYTGYNKVEIEDKVELLKQFSNIIIKFGRFIPNQQPHYDEVLGVELASPNQYAERIS